MLNHIHKNGTLAVCVYRSLPCRPKDNTSQNPHFHQEVRYITVNY